MCDALRTYENKHIYPQDILANASNSYFYQSMNIENDYYAILGVLPSAETIVIKAAYRALSKRYHPDVYKGANIAEKMADINEAYETLSSDDKKAAYDEARGSRSQDADEYFNDDFGTHNTVDPLDADWKVAVKYHPDLEDAAAKLTKYSKKIAYTYKAYMLETKDFDNIQRAARAAAEEFLEIHFGQNEGIIAFAEELFNDDRKDILLELNRAVKVLGVSNADRRIIYKLKAEYNYLTSRDRFNSWLSELEGHECLNHSTAKKIFIIWKSSPNEAQRVAKEQIITVARMEEASREAAQDEKSQRNTVIIVVATVMLIAFFVFMERTGS